MKKKKIKVHFEEMPHYTRSEEYRFREYVRKRGYSYSDSLGDGLDEEQEFSDDMQWVDGWGDLD